MIWIKWLLTCFICSILPEIPFKKVDSKNMTKNLSILGPRFSVMKNFASLWQIVANWRYNTSIDSRKRKKITGSKGLIKFVLRQNTFQVMEKRSFLFFSLVNHVIIWGKSTYIKLLVAIHNQRKEKLCFHLLPKQCTSAADSFSGTFFYFYWILILETSNAQH